MVPHFHRHYDETIFGVDGITTWTVDGATIEVGAGHQLFVPRGSHHSYANLHPQSARILCLVTPGVLGPEYFQELAFAMETEETSEYDATVALVMTRYGVIPASAKGELSAAIAATLKQPWYAPTRNRLAAD